MPIFAVILAAALLAQANDFITFDICRVDYTASPPEARHARDQEPIELQRGAFNRFQALPGHYGGISCVRISDGVSMIFVVGTADEVRAKLRGKP